VVLENNKTFTNNLKKINMGKAKTIITITGVFMLLFSYGIMSGNMNLSGGSNSDQTSPKSIQTKTKSTQTDSKSVQTKTKSVQTGSKSTQTGSKSTQTGSKSTQTGSKSTQTGSKPVQTKTKPTQTGSKSTQAKSKAIPKSTKSEPVNKITDFRTVRIGTQTWAVANLNVSTFQNGDSIPEARTNKEWVTAGESGKPAWCYYNNDPKLGQKYGKLYNWFAVNDPRELAPAGWTLTNDADWAELAYNLGGQEVAGNKLKNNSGWSEGSDGTNESGFMGLPGGYRVENGIFLNLGSIGTWWSTNESKTTSAIDHYLVQRSNLGRSISPKQRGESVRCLRK
jgi:uncharacterized protein (TIGR02145 family)